jgi:hypothetical protein
MLLRNDGRHRGAIDQHASHTLQRGVDRVKISLAQ